ncbi:hypothetical protein [Botrimarina sp.]|uniref:hypothetical protein n=1 Tax=Botrimarina sp. TaxID=2795802 RepID=UPI0032EF314E
MPRLIAAALCLAAAPAALAQYPGAAGQPGRPQTAMAALGQTNLLNRQPMARQAAYRVAARSGAAPVAQGKPFSAVSSSPTVSPYLNLFRSEDDRAAPNYYTFVQPQIQQNEMAQQQRMQLDRLQRQVQQASYNRPTVPSTGPARYGDTGRWYSGWQR